jgi:hypothetical protein
VKTKNVECVNLGRKGITSNGNIKRSAKKFTMRFGIGMKEKLNERNYK